MSPVIFWMLRVEIKKALKNRCYCELVCLFAYHLNSFFRSFAAWLAVQSKEKRYAWLNVFIMLSLFKMARASKDLRADAIFFRTTLVKVSHAIS